MKKLLTWLSKRRFPYEPLITLSISKKGLFHNLDSFKKLAPGGFVAPVLKSNAYGHGIIDIARMLERKKDDSVPFFVVDSYFEAVALHASGINTPLLVIGYSRPESLLGVRLRGVAFAITNIETLRSVAKAPRSIYIHLKIDTGMRRQGILPEEITEAIALLKDNPHIVVEGICSHLSSADDASSAFTERQITEWNSIVKRFKNEFLTLKYIHLSATDGHLFNDKIEANVSRLGLGLYGISENAALAQQLHLQPVLGMRTIITGVKKLMKGETVGYGNTFTAPADMTIATIPVGYFEGLDRRLSNKGFVLVGKERAMCPIVGKVSMNITTVDVSKTPVAINDPVIVISSNPNDVNSIHGMVEMIPGVIPYELAVKIPAHLKRVVVS
jgi:alanine racemase